jgi:hypothetical protein
VRSVTTPVTRHGDVPSQPVGAVPDGITVVERNDMRSSA